jgi:hypothetical protein
MCRKEGGEDRGGKTFVGGFCPIYGLVVSCLFSRESAMILLKMALSEVVVPKQ